jgi:hypothetical protein
LINLKDKWILDVLEFINNHSEGLVDNIPYSNYFLFNLRRFQLGRMLIYNNIKLNTEFKVLDLGTTMPFQSLFLNKEHNCYLECADIKNKNIQETEKISFSQLDICKEELKDEYDLLILENILEYLPCNLLELRERLMKNVYKNGYVLTSFEINKFNSLPLHGRIINPNLNYPKTRQFSYLEANKFVRSLNLVPLEKKILKHYQFSETLIVLSQVL